MNSDSLSSQARRRFLKTATAVAGVTVASGVTLTQLAVAKPADQSVSSKNRWGLLIDSNKCGDGCNECVSACNEEHGLVSHGRPETDAQYIRKVTLKDKATGHVTSLPMMCQHCETAPCADVCPTGASFRRDDGIVLVDKHICIGCRYCMMACPYKARSFVHEVIEDQVPTTPRGKGTVESCNLCVNRVDAGSKPACVEACNGHANGAMVFGDLNDPDSAISKELRSFGGTQIRADLGLNPGVRYRGL